MHTIIFYWMRWTGKSTIWKKVASELWYIFIDLDIFIEKKVWMKLDKYIAKVWWDKFRNTEHESLKEVLNQDREKIAASFSWEGEKIQDRGMKKKLISLGWWTIVFERNIAEINKLEHKISFFLETNINEIAKRIQKDEENDENRPSLTWEDVVTELKKVYEQRESIYKNNADEIVDNNWAIEETIKTLVQIINKRKICIPITNFEENYIKKTFEKLKKIDEISYIELRIDFLKDLTRLKSLIEDCPKKVIITNRIKEEWWKFEWNYKKSLEIQKKALELWADLVDLELQTLETIKNPEINFEKIIISSHNFEETPSLEKLIKILEKMKKYNPKVYKIAVKPNKEEDVDTIYKLSEYFKENFTRSEYIFISMWELWKQTRINIPKQWAMLTFASFEGDISAPWQIGYKEIYEKIVLS